MPQEFPPCSADQVVIQALTDKESYGKGEKVQMHFMLVNTGKEPCTLNAGTTQQEYEIRDAAGGVVFRFSDCRKDAVDQLIALQPNEPRRTMPIEWDRRMSNKDKCGEEGREVPAGDAVYTLRVGIGQVQGEGERQFRLD